jgi:hypothetical protein
MSKEGPEVIKGERFEGYVSQNRKLADINDPKMHGKLILMSKTAVIELRDLCQEIINLMGGD